MRKVVWGLVGLSVLGCATPQRRAEQADWRTVCANAPYGEGQSITASEQRAMTRLRVQAGVPITPELRRRMADDPVLVSDLQNLKLYESLLVGVGK